MVYKPITLSDGSHLLLREPRPEDREKLLEGFANLSDSSRYSRFLHHKKQLSDSEVDKFLKPASADHYSIAAAEVDIESKNNNGKGVGIAHLFCSDESAKTAEVAITIIDEYQNRGLGYILLKYIQQQAINRNFKHLRFDMLASNTKMWKLIQSMDRPYTFTRSDGIVECYISLASMLGKENKLKMESRNPGINLFVTN